MLHYGLRAILGHFARPRIITDFCKQFIIKLTIDENRFPNCQIRQTQLNLHEPNKDKLSYWGNIKIDFHDRS
jgi:hypothetical protein